MPKKRQAPKVSEGLVKIADKLKITQKRYFVGRDAEKLIFKSLISGSDLAYVLLHIYGPGGVGKSSLLREFLTLARQKDILPLFLDARKIDASPKEFLKSLATALDIDSNLVLNEINSQAAKVLIVIDSYELLKPLDAWLREVFFPQLSQNTIIILAGRKPLTAPWRSDSAWSDLIHEINLRNLSPEESRLFLKKRNVLKNQYDKVLKLTHGHPLALSLMVDVFKNKEEIDFQFSDNPNIVRTLLNRFLDQSPDLLHRKALEASALVRYCSEGLLKELLELDDAHELFNWLRNLSFTESDKTGLFLHDLVREIIDTDLNWRNPDYYTEIHKRARAYYSKHLLITRGAAQRRLIIDNIYLHRHNPIVKPFYEWENLAGVFSEKASKEDYDVILNMIKTSEGSESFKHAKYWLSIQPEGLKVYRDINNKVTGLMFTLELGQLAQTDINKDPATKAVMDFANRFAPPREAEEIIFFRFWMAAEGYQTFSPTQGVIFLDMLQEYLSRPKLAWSFLPCADSDFWFPIFQYADINRVKEADFKLDNKSFDIFAHDWRVRPVSAWLELLGKRELRTDLKAEDLKSKFSVDAVVLSEVEFRIAVKDALRNINKLSKLSNNPLLQSRLLRDINKTPRVNDLTCLLKQTVDNLKNNPKDEKYYRAVMRTYIEAAASQEIAAELLNLPFSTYRRHLSRGINRIIEVLWQYEIYGNSKN